MLGLVSGADRSILNIPLSHGLKFEERSPEDIIPLVGRLAGMDYWAARRQLFLDQVIWPEHPLITISGELAIEPWPTDKPDEWPQESGVQAGAVAHNYLHELFGLIRLYRPSSVLLKAYYTYLARGGAMRPSESFYDGNRLYGPRFSISDSELDGLIRFLAEWRLPLGRNHLDLAAEMCDLSLRVMVPGLQVVVAMMGFDALLGDDGVRARRRIIAGTAALLADSAVQYDEIRRELDRFYDLRSAILHSPSPRKATSGEVEHLRELLSRSIQAAHRITGDKESLKLELERRSLFYGDPTPPIAGGLGPSEPTA